jgi:hypothetical protein
MVLNVKFAGWSAAAEERLIHLSQYAVLYWETCIFILVVFSASVWVRGGMVQPLPAVNGVMGRNHMSPAAGQGSGVCCGGGRS